MVWGGWGGGGYSAGIIPHIEDSNTIVYPSLEKMKRMLNTVLKQY